MTPRCEMRVDGRRCPEESTALIGAGCVECEPTANYACEEHTIIVLALPWNCDVHNLPSRTLEVIDLVRADPGPAYAQLLKEL
jgi:hypothetical protein